MIGRTLRQYHITAHLGRGGMGEVWKARDTILERDVALKVLPAHEGDAAARRERFFREARAASALNHPSIVTIYEINADQGVDFIAMEYVEGHTLRDLLQRGTLPVDTIFRYALQIAEAVGRAHRAGIVHRDLKPGNIMVTADGLVKVLDFGLAQMDRTASRAPEAATQMALTMAGISMGTVGYMSPEQAAGDPVDASSDVFSYGVILYELLTGRRPFVATRLLDLLHELHFSAPPAVTSLRSDTPPVLSAIVARSLAKRPADRPADLTEVATALRLSSADSLSATAVAPPPAGVSEVHPRREPSARWRWGLAAGLVALAVVVAVGTVSRLRGPSAATPEAGLGPPAGAAPAVDVPAEVPDLTREAAALLARQDREGNVDRAIGLLERALQLDRDAAVAHAYLADAYRRKRLTNPDAQWVNLARESAERAIALNPDLAAGRLALGYVHLEAGDHAAAIAAFRRAADLDPANPLPFEGLGQALAAAKQDADAVAAFSRALQLGPQDWRPYISFGQFHFSRAHYAEAATQWEAALRLTPDNGLVLRNLGAAYYLLERPDEAASILQRALEIRPTGPTYTNLGTIRFFQGRYSDAVAAFEKAVDLNPNSHQYWANLGDGYRWAPGRRGEAPAAYRRAIELVQAELGKKPGDADLRSRHGMYTAKMGDLASARRATDGLDREPSLTAQMLYRLTVVHELLGERTEALTTLARALKAGYPAKDLANEPEFVGLRRDVRYHRLVAGR